MVKKPGNTELKQCNIYVKKVTMNWKNQRKLQFEATETVDNLYWQKQKVMLQKFSQLLQQQQQQQQAALFVLLSKLADQK